MSFSPVRAKEFSPGCKPWETSKIMIIRYKKDIEPEIQQQIDAALTPWLWLVPGWVQRLSVIFKDGGKNKSVQIEIKHDYRTVKLTVFSAWLNQPDADRQENFVHELVHIPMSLLYDFAVDKIDLLCPHDRNEAFNASLQEDLRERHEAATQDLAKAIFEKFYQGTREV